MRIILSRSSANYLQKETHYLKRHNPQAAANFVALIRDVKRNLSRFPEMGSKELHLPIKGSRTWIAGDYLLDYVWNKDEIVIVNIRHGRMKPIPPSDDELLDDS
jgi:plasmid stabilization system protein ParE